MEGSFLAYLTLKHLEREGPEDNASDLSDVVALGTNTERISGGRNGDCSYLLGSVLGIAWRWNRSPLLVSFLLSR